MKAYPRASDCKKVRHIGIETEIDITSTTEKRSSLDQTNLVRLEYPGMVEFRTIPISVNSFHNVRGSKRIREHFDIIKSATKIAKWGGTHLHISILDKDNPNMEANALALTIAFYRQFQKISGRASTWARKPGANTIGAAKALVGDMRDEYTRRRIYNRQFFMITPSGYQTLEFRGPKGSNDADEILAWAEFLENTVKVANQDSVNGVMFKDLLVGDRISAYCKKLKLTAKELNKTLNEAKLV